MVKIPSVDFPDPNEVKEEERARIAGRPTRIEGLPDKIPEGTPAERVTEAQEQINEWSRLEKGAPEPEAPVEYSFVRKAASGIPGFLYGGTKGLVQTAQAVDLFPTGGQFDLRLNYFTDDNFYRKLDMMPARADFLRTYAYNYGKEAADKLNAEDKDFASQVVVRPPLNMIQALGDTFLGRTMLGKFRVELPQNEEDKSALNEFLNIYINEGFQNSPMYKANPAYWDSLKEQNSEEFIKMLRLYDESYELKRRAEFDEYNMVYQSYKGFVDHSLKLAQGDASWWEGVKQDFNMMAAGTYEFLLTGIGLGEDKVGQTPFQAATEFGTSLTAGLAGTLAAALALDPGGAKFPEEMPLVGGVRMPAAFRKPMIIAGLIGPKITRIAAGKISKAQARRVAEYRKKDPAFDSLIRAFERGEAAYPKRSDIPLEARYSRPVRALEEATGIPSRLGRVLEKPITTATRVGDDGVARPVLPMRADPKVLKGSKAPSFGEPIPGAPRQMTWGDLSSALLHGAGIWTWTGAPELGFINPAVRLTHAALQNSNRYNRTLNKMRQKFQRTWENTREDTPTADRMAYMHQKIQNIARETRGADFVSRIKQQAKEGGDLEWTPFPDIDYVVQDKPGETVMGAAFDPNVQPTPRVIGPRIVRVEPPPPKGGEAPTPTPTPAKPAQATPAPEVKPPVADPAFEFGPVEQRAGFGSTLRTGVATPERPPAYTVPLGQGDFAAVNIINRRTAQGIENARMLPAMKKAAVEYIKDLRAGIETLKKAIARDKAQAPGRRKTWMKANEQRRQEIRYLEDSIESIRIAVLEIAEQMGRLDEGTIEANVSGLREAFGEIGKARARGTKEGIDKTLKDVSGVSKGDISGVEVFAFKDLLWESARDILEAENEALLSRQASTLRKLETAYGRRAVAKAVNESRAQGLFDLTPDGSIIEGSPLARLVESGTVPRSVQPKGQYAKADPFKPGDPPQWVLDRDGLPTKENEFYNWELLGEKVELAEGPVWTLDSKGRPIIRQSMDVTKGNPDALERSVFDAKLVEKSMRPKRESAPPTQRFREFDDAYQEAYTNLETLSIKELGEKAGELGLLVSRPTRTTLAPQKAPSRLRSLDERIRERQTGVRKRPEQEVFSETGEVLAEFKSPETTKPRLEVSPKTGQFIVRSDLTKAQDVAVYKIGKESYTMDAAGRARLIDRLARLEAAQKIAIQPEAAPAKPTGFKTTIDSPNRVRDAKRVADEHGGLLKEQGYKNIEFTDENGTVLATGYDRVVYGDHGPYIEFSPSQVNMKAFPRIKKKGKKAWYDEGRTADGKVLLYMQKKDVSTLPNPPKGKYSANNNRAEGYADYKPGKYYISPDEVFSSPAIPDYRSIARSEFKPESFPPGITILESAAQKYTREQALSKERAVTRASQEVARAEQGLSLAREKRARILDEINQRARQQEEFLSRPRSTRAKAVVARTKLANQDKARAKAERARADEIVKAAQRKLDEAKENLIKEQRQDVVAPPRKAEATTQRVAEDLPTRPKKAEPARVVEQRNRLEMAKDTSKQEFYRLEFNRLARESGKRQVGLEMYNLMKRLMKEDDYKQAADGTYKGIPFTATPEMLSVRGPKAQIPVTKKAMLEASLNYIPEGLGKGAKTTDPSRYPNARAEIQAYIRGEVPRDLLAKGEIGERTVVKFGEEVQADIARVRKAFDEGTITPDEHVTAMADILNQLKEDLAEGLAEKIDPEPRPTGKRPERARNKVRYVRSVIGKYALRRAETMGKEAPPVTRVVREGKGFTMQRGVTEKAPARVVEPRGRGAFSVQAQVRREVAPLIQQANLALEQAQTKNVTIPGTREHSLTLTANAILEGKQPKLGSNRFKQMIARLRDDYGKGKPLSPLREQVYASSMSIAEKYVFERTVRALEADTGNIYKGIQKLHHDRAALKAELAHANKVTPDVPAMEVNISPEAKGRPLQATQPKAKPKPRREEPRYEQEFKSITDVKMPVELQRELRRVQRKFLDDANMSVPQTEAFLASIVDAFGDGISLLASPRAKEIVTNGAIKSIEKQLGRALTELEVNRFGEAFNDYLAQFNKPFEGRAQLAKYSSQPDYRSPAAVARAVLRKIPSRFLIKGKDNAVLAQVNPAELFYNQLQQLKKTDPKSKPGQALTQIQNEAYQAIYNSYVAQAKKELTSTFVKAEMDRLGISYASTAVDAAARIAISRLLYQDSMPIALPSRLAELVEVKRDGIEGSYVNRELTSVSAKDIARAIRTNPEQIIDALNSELKSRGKKQLTDEQVLEITGRRPGPEFPVEQGSKLDQLASKLERYDSPENLAKKQRETYDAFAKAFALDENPSQFPAFLDADAQWIASPLMESQAKGPKARRVGLDEAPQEYAGDVAMSSFMHPDWMESVAFNAQLFDAMSKMDTWNSLMKGNVTFGAMLTHLGNTLSHSMAAALHRGQNPISLYNDIAMTAWAFKTWKKDKANFEGKSSKIKGASRLYDKDAFAALDEHASIKNLDFISAENVQSVFPQDGLLGKVFAPLRKKDDMLRKLYQMEDNGPRLYEAVSEYRAVTKDLALLKDGEFLELQTSRNGYAVVRKQNGKFMQGNRVLDRRGLDKLKVSQAMYRASNRVVNYNNIPRFIKELRIGKAIGPLGAFVSPFISFPYLALDIPFVKKGIVAGTVFDGGVNSRGKTNSPEVMTRRMREDANRAIRIAAYGLAMQSIAHPNTDDLQGVTRFKLEPGSVASALVRSSPNHNVIQTWRWNNANQYEMTFLGLENVMAVQAWIANGYLEMTGGGLFGSKKPNKAMREFQRATQEGRVLSVNDVTRLGALTGNFWLKPLVKMFYSGETGRSKGWRDYPAAMDALAGAVAGTDNWSFLKTVAPLTGAITAKDSLSGYRSMINDLERTDQLKFEDLTPQEQMDFMLNNFVESVSRIYFRQRKILENDKEINQATRNLLQGIRSGMVDPLDTQIKAATNKEERQKLVKLRTLVDRSIKKYAKAQGNFYRALRDVESYRGVVGKKRLQKDKEYQFRRKVLEGRRIERTQARKELDRQKDSIRQRAAKARKEAR